MVVVEAVVAARNPRDELSWNTPLITFAGLASKNIACGGSEIAAAHVRRDWFRGASGGNGVSVGIGGGAL